MPEKETNRSPKLRVPAAHSASGERPVARVAPERTPSSGRQSSVRPRADAVLPVVDRAPSASAELADVYASDEPPTVSLSKPMLNLLVRETTAPETDATPTVSMPVAAPVTSSAVPEPSVVVELDDTQTRARVRLPLAQPHTPPRRANLRTSLLVAAFVPAVAAVAVGAWLYVNRAGSALVKARAPMAASAAPSTEVSTASARALAASAEPAAVPAALRVEEPVSAPPVADDRGAGQANAHPPTLVAVDGSEANAPTCESLLDGVPADNETTSGFDHVRAARKALVRGDVGGSQREFCQALRSGSADATAFFELAQLLLLRRDPAAAAQWAQQAAQVEPQSSRVLDLLGDTVVRTGNVDEARKAWLAAAKVAEHDSAGIGRMVRSTLDAANSSLKDRDPARAERLLRRVIAFQPDNVAAHAKMALVLVKLGFPKSAERWAQRGAELTATPGR